MRVLVQPLERLPVLLLNRRRQPDDDRGVQTAGVRQELAQMRVVALLELVLDQDLRAGADVGAD